MISDSIEKYQTFGYRFLDTSLIIPAQLNSLGRQLKGGNYLCDGLKRESENGSYIFQYTISGSGNLSIGNSHYTIDEGKAFLVSLPQNHKYYISDESSWEFIFVTLTGSYTEQVWKQITTAHGPVIDFKNNLSFTNYLLDYYLDACTKKFNNPFDSSLAAYSFLMKLQYYLDKPAKKKQYRSDDTNHADHMIQYMKDHLSDSIGLDDIADDSGLSKYYLDRIFCQQTGVSPWVYFIKMRIEHASRLLVSTVLPITEVSAKSGFDNANYFNKVFRKYVGMSAGQFRSKYKDMTDFILKL